MIANSEVEELETEAPVRSVEKAFVESGPKTVDELAVRPWTPDKEVAAQAMVLHYGYVDEVGAELFKRTKLYPGAVRDVAIVMWLCCKATDDDIDAAGVMPKPARKKAVDWAKSEGLLDTGEDRFWKAFQVMLTIFDEIFVSRSKPKKKATSELPNLSQTA